MSRAKKSGTTVDTTTATSSLEIGKQVYENSCVNCHGADGKLGLSGAKELGATQLTTEEQKSIIRNGKNSMPAHSQLTEEQVNGVVEYIATFKQ
jgi:mono/diheme cytochrome c family protein